MKNIRLGENNGDNMVCENAYNDIIGNDTVKSALMGFTKRDAFPHALIFSGPKGSGKSTFACLAAMSVACLSENKPCGECQACRKIREGISPDVITVGTQKDRKTIGVEAVRQIRDTVYTVPNDLSVKVYIINDAEKMTVQAQNALLKLFEEPPEGVYFFLLCTSSAELLTTVRSRAPELRTEVFSEGRLTELLKANSKTASALAEQDHDTFKRLLHLSGGSYGEAKRLTESKAGKALEIFESAESVLDTLSGNDRAELLICVNRFAVSRDGFTELIRRLMTAVRDMTAVKRGEGISDEALMFFADISQAKKYSERFTLKALTNIYGILETSEAELSETNINLTTASMVLSDKLWSVK